MGKGKKSSGKHYTSKGERRSSIGYRDEPAQRVINQIRARKQGKRIVVTMENPNKAQTNKPFIRVMYDLKTPGGQVLS